MIIIVMVNSNSSIVTVYFVLVIVIVISTIINVIFITIIIICHKYHLWKTKRNGNILVFLELSSKDHFLPIKMHTNSKVLLWLWLYFDSVYTFIYLLIHLNNTCSISTIHVNSCFILKSNHVQSLVSLKINVSHEEIQKIIYLYLCQLYYVLLYRSVWSHHFHMFYFELYLITPQVSKWRVSELNRRNI